MLIACLFAAALTFAGAIDRTLQIVSIGMPLLTAGLALLAAKQTVVHSLRSHDRTTWIWRTRWAFDVILNPHADAANLRTAVESLRRQLDTGEVPEEEFPTVDCMIDNAMNRLSRMHLTNRH